MRRLNLIVFFVFALPLYTAPVFAEDLVWADSEARDLFRLAGQLFQQQKYPAAAKSYREFLRTYANDLRAPDAQMMLAESMYRQALAESSTTELPSEKALAEAEKEYRAAVG